MRNIHSTIHVIEIISLNFSHKISFAQESFSIPIREMRIYTIQYTILK